MPLTVLSAVIAVDTRFNPDLNLKSKTIDDKCNFLAGCAQAADQGFNALCPTGIRAGSLKFLLAPEYFFGLPQCDAQSAVNAYNDAERNNIVRQCEAISGRFPDILMLPGTILYTRRIGRAERKMIAAELEQQANIYQRMGAGTTMLATRAAAGAQDVKLKGKGIAETLGLRDSRLFGYNSAELYFGGHRIATFNKADNASEFAAENPKPTLVPGVGANTLLYPGTNISVGVEVCADHGRLHQSGQQVRIQLLISAQISVNVNSVTVPDNGLVIACNGGTSTLRESGVYTSSTTGQSYNQTKGGGYMDVNADRTRNKAAPVNSSVRCQRTDLS